MGREVRDLHRSWKKMAAHRQTAPLSQGDLGSFLGPVSLSEAAGACRQGLP